MGYLNIIFTGIVLGLVTASCSASSSLRVCTYTNFRCEPDNSQYDTCKPDVAGQLKFSEGKLFVCNEKEWKALQYGSSEPSTGSTTDGSRVNPGSSCRDILNNAECYHPNGVYWITLGAKQDSFPVYCDMAAGGWTMAFKAVSREGQNVYSAYLSDGTYAENKISALDVTNAHRGHYKNRIVLKWKDFGASEARVVLYKGGNLLKELRFNAKGSDNVNWFAFEKLTRSPWSDLTGAHPEPRNYFSIRGDPRFGRYFFINKNYGGCSRDAGWLIIAGPGCGWENKRKNAVLYSTGNGYTNWNNHGGVGEADALVVYVR